MHARGRIRGKNIRYIKNPNKIFFSRPEPLSEARAMHGEHTINQTKLHRQPDFPARDIPKANRSKKN